MATPRVDTGDELPASLATIANQLADEGVPVGAIARSINIPFADVSKFLQKSVVAGKIIQVPKADWPVDKHSTRDTRLPQFDLFTGYNEEMLLLTLIRIYKVSKLQAAFFGALLRRKEVTRQALHEIIESRRSPDADETEEKMVDVVICNLRKRLKPHHLIIKTIWSAGYYIETDQRRQVRDTLNEHAQAAMPEGAKPLAAMIKVDDDDEDDVSPLG